MLPVRDNRSSRGLYTTCAFCRGEGCAVCASASLKRQLEIAVREDAERCIDALEKQADKPGMWNSMPEHIKQVVIWSIAWGRNEDYAGVEVEQPPAFDRFHILEYNDMAVTQCGDKRP